MISFKVVYVVLCLAARLRLGANAIFSVPAHKSSPTASLKAQAHLCNQAYDQSSCLAFVSEVITKRPSAGIGLIQFGVPDLLGMILAKSRSRIRETMEFADRVNSRINHKTWLPPVALADCLQLLDSSMDRTADSMAALARPTATSRWDVPIWLSGILTNHITCLDGLNGSARSAMEPMMNELISRARTSLALMVAIAVPPKEELLRPLNGGDLPSWITGMDRRLLEASGSGKKMMMINNADSVVARDGSGDHRTVQAAIDAAPDNAQTRYVIYVKKGTYKEQVNIGQSKKNLMLVGDGMDSTIITGSLNVVDGSSTLSSATVAAVADGFIAQDLSIQNSAGPQKSQAVALLVRADQVVINRCKIDAYQDTLYAHSLRQFYRDCYITGTVDFIFGDAAVVFQNCQLVARKPLSGQQNVVTAQGRTDPNSPTGTSIQYCSIIPSSDLGPVKGSIKTYLGRPWKEYSRTVVMQSSIGDHIDPAGWSPWIGDFALKTLFYGEYKNSGPGSKTSKRVKWPGYHVITSASKASKFTVAQLLQGGQWLKNTGVTYTEGL